jgi:hypothetical protein
VAIGGNIVTFENAHTPTDDERNALAKRIADLLNDYTGESFAAESYMLADALIDEGFSRSEVPEPRAACLTEHPITGRRCSQPAEPRHAHVCDLPPESQGEPSDAILKAFEDEWYRLDGVTEPERHRRALRAALDIAWRVR